MKPCQFHAVGAPELSVNFQQGISVKYDEELVDATIKTDTNLQNPSFAGKFKLPPGEASIAIKGGKVDKLTLSPNLKEFDSKLDIFPLEGGKFVLNVQKKCPCSGTKVEFGYDSSIAKGSVAVSPEIKIKDVEIDSKFIFKGMEEKPLIQIDHFIVDWKNLRFCACYNKTKDVKTDEYRFATFADLKKVNVGGLFHFGVETKQLEDIEVFGKTQVKNIDVAVIGNVFKKNIEIRAGGPLCCECPCSKFGAKAAYSQQGISFDLGLKTCCKGCGIKANLMTTKAEALKATLIAGVDFPIHGLGKGSAAIKFEDLTAPSKYACSFGVALKQ